MSSIAEVHTAECPTVDELCALDVDRLSDEDIASTLRTVERLRRRLDGLDARLVAQVEQRGLENAVKLSTPQKYLVELLHLSRADAVRRVKNARLLAPRTTPSGTALAPILQVTAAAVADGDASAAHVDAIRKVTEKIPGRFGNDVVETVDRILGTLSRTATPDDITTAGIDLLA
ncbi:DUF222 domain-containing protein, partial [Rhodococcus sp. CX]|uniref:DUF222 domain-containing protein n=1 Tax=Rhodococcus sp. CX TaxID=2789880 RepID=UPI0018CDACEB